MRARARARPCAYCMVEVLVITLCPVPMRLGLGLGLVPAAMHMVGRGVGGHTVSCSLMDHEGSYGRVCQPRSQQLVNWSD